MSGMESNAVMIPIRSNKLPTRPYSYSDWSLNTVDKSFLFEPGSFINALAFERPIKNVNDLLSHVSDDEKVGILDVVKRLSKSGGAEYLSCCVRPNNNYVVYTELYIERLDKHTIQGTVRQMLVLPNGDQMTNVFLALFENSHHGVVITDEQTRILTCNQYFENQTGFSRNDLIGLKTNILNADKHSPEFYQQMWCQVDEQGYWKGDILSCHANGSIYPQELTIQKLQLNGQTYYIGLTVDLSNDLGRVAGEGEGDVEMLTQLPTKEKFIELLQHRCESPLSESGKIVLVMEPKIAEEHAHSQQLAFSGMLLRNRHCYIAGYLSNGLFIACVEYPMVAQGTPSRALQQSIKQFFSDCKLEGGDEMHSRITNGRVGVSLLGYDTDSPARSVIHATQAMLENHGSSKSVINFYHSKIHKELMRKKRLEEVVESVLAQKAIEVYYQPIIDTATWRIVKFEALCHFTSTRESSFNTQEMINVAEDLDLIPELDKLVGEKSLQALPTIRQVYGETTGLTINRSLNTKLSAKQILRNTVDLIEKYTDCPENITIELTESAYFDSESSHKDALNELRKHGVSVAIDDFGTGYSSFSYLSDSHFDYLKIDKDFVTDIEVKSNKYHIVKMITQLSNTLGVKVIAEGVETLHEARTLQALGIDYMQGYFFSKPIPIERIDEAQLYECKPEFKDLGDFAVQHNAIYTLAKHRRVALDPGDSVSFATKLFESDARLITVPVITEQKCVGIIGKREINLYLTPTMGTDLESSKESAIWRRSIHQMMSLSFSQIDYRTSLEEIRVLLEEHPRFPWILVNEDGKFKGIVEQRDVLDYLLNTDAIPEVQPEYQI
ncbi:EAL domain-containing protein [Vibrio paucivorans]